MTLFSDCRKFFSGGLVLISVVAPSQGVAQVERLVDRVGTALNAVPHLDPARFDWGNSDDLMAEEHAALREALTDFKNSKNLGAWPELEELNRSLVFKHPELRFALQKVVSFLPDVENFKNPWKQTRLKPTGVFRCDVNQDDRLDLTDFALVKVSENKNKSVRQLRQWKNLLGAGFIQKFSLIIGEIRKKTIKHPLVFSRWIKVFSLEALEKGEAPFSDFKIQLQRLLSDVPDEIFFDERIAQLFELQNDLNQSYAYFDDSSVNWDKAKRCDAEKMIEPLSYYFWGDHPSRFVFLPREVFSADGDLKYFGQVLELLTALVNAPQMISMEKKVSSFRFVKEWMTPSDNRISPEARSPDVRDCFFSKSRVLPPKSEIFELNGAHGFFRRYFDVVGTETSIQTDELNAYLDYLYFFKHDKGVKAKIREEQVYNFLYGGLWIGLVIDYFGHSDREGLLRFNFDQNSKIDERDLNHFVILRSWVESARH